MSKIIVITGKNGAGKSSAIHFLQEEFGGAVFRPSDLTRSILSEFQIPESRENLSKMMSALRKTFTQDIYVFAAFNFIEKNPAKNIYFDGIRKLYFLQKLKKNYDIKIIFIDADIENRYARVRDRSEKEGENDLSFEDFIEQERLESENETDVIRALADRVIQNNDSEDQFYKKISALLE